MKEVNHTKWDLTLVVLLIIRMYLTEYLRHENSFLWGCFNKDCLINQFFLVTCSFQGMQSFIWATEAIRNNYVKDHLSFCHQKWITSHILRRFCSRIFLRVSKQLSIEKWNLNLNERLYFSGLTVYQVVQFVYLFWSG